VRPDKGDHSYKSFYPSSQYIRINNAIKNVSARSPGKSVVVGNIALE
jgi:hypothetical protein